MARFFKIPIHYQGNRQIFSVTGTDRTPAPEVNDNDYRTSSTETTYIVQTHGDTPTTNTKVNWIFIKGSGITGYNVSIPTGMGSGDGITGRTIPDTVTAADGSLHNTTINGIQHDLLNLGALTLVANQAPLRNSSIAIANNLSSVTDPTTISLNLDAAELSNIATPGIVVIQGENPAGTAVSQTISYPNHELTDTKSTVQAYTTITSISAAGFKSGDITITGDNSTLDCTEVQIEFTGNPTIYEIMLLEELLYLHPERSFINYSDNQDDNSIEKRNIRGSGFRIRSLASRAKWTANYRALFSYYSSVTAEVFIRMATNNSNFTFAQDSNRYPDRIYPATWGSGNFNQRYYTRRISSGTTIDFTVEEQ